MDKFVVPLKAHPGLSLEEMKAFVINHFEDFVNLKKSEVTHGRQQKNPLGRELNFTASYFGASRTERSWNVGPLSLHLNQSELKEVSSP